MTKRVKIIRTFFDYPFGRCCVYYYTDEPRVGYIANLFVNEDCRSRGVGVMIISGAELFMKSHGMKISRLLAASYRLVRYYEKRGYRKLSAPLWLEKNISKQNIKY